MAYQASGILPARVRDSLRSPGTRASGRGATGLYSLAGWMMGTPAYMRPEQALGEVEEMYERSDVFGLGAILCEVLTGKPPYVGDGAKTIHKLASRGALDDAMSRLGSSGADGEVIALAKKCLAIEPRERPAAAGVVAREIRAYIDSLAARAREAELKAAEEKGKALGERKARRLTVTIGVTVLLAVLGGGGGYFVAETSRQERAALAASAVLKTVAEASKLCGEAQGAGAQSTPARVKDLSRWDAALEAARRAASLVTPETPDRARQKAEELLALVEKERAAVEGALKVEARNNGLVRELERIRMEHDEELEASRRAQAYEKFFKDQGIDCPCRRSQAGAPAHRDERHRARPRARPRRLGESPERGAR